MLKIRLIWLPKCPIQNLLIFIIFYILIFFSIEEAVAVLGNKIVEDLRTQDPDEGIEWWRSEWNVEEWSVDLSAILLFNDFNIFVKLLFITL